MNEENIKLIEDSLGSVVEVMNRGLYKKITDLHGKIFIEYLKLGFSKEEAIKLVEFEKAGIINEKLRGRIIKMKQELKERLTGINNQGSYLKIISLDGLSTRINMNYVRQINIEDDEIVMRCERDWTHIMRYNPRTVEKQLKITEQGNRDLFRDHDRYWGRGSGEKMIQRAQELERNWLESLDTGIEADTSMDIGFTFSVDSNSFSWLRDKDFDKLKQLLESMTDKFAVKIERG